MDINVRYYALNTSNIQPAETRMICNKCGIKNLQPHFNFCPNCGITFIKEVDVIIDKETITIKDVGDVIDLFK